MAGARGSVMRRMASSPVGTDIPTSTSGIRLKRSASRVTRGERVRMLTANAGASASASRQRRVIRASRSTPWYGSVTRLSDTRPGARRPSSRRSTSGALLLMSTKAPHGSVRPR